jgi:hypothetical protein
VKAVPDIWFVVGLALGMIVTGFCAIGSFDRGSDSVRRRSWSLEHEARKPALIAARVRLRDGAQESDEGRAATAS